MAIHSHNSISLGEWQVAGPCFVSECWGAGEELVLHFIPCFKHCLQSILLGSCSKATWIKAGEKPSVPPLFSLPWDGIDSEVELFYCYTLILKEQTFVPSTLGAATWCHIWYLSLHEASLHSAKLFSCSSSRIQRQRPCGAGGADLCYWCQEGADLFCSAMLCNVLLPGSNSVNLSGIKIDEILCCHQALRNTWFSWTAVTQSGNCSQKVRKLLRKESLYCCFLFEVQNWY